MIYGRGRGLGGELDIVAECAIKLNVSFESQCSLLCILPTFLNGRIISVETFIENENLGNDKLQIVLFA